MADYQLLLDLVSKQEASLQFDRFSIEMAHEIGLGLMKKAKEDKLPVAIDITRHGQQLFHVSLQGATPDNDGWIKRKMAVVNRFSHSSYYMSLALSMKNITIEEAYLLDEKDYAAHGGSFPITLKDTGVIGSITVSGLPSADDHQLVVDVLSAYLNVQGETP